MWADGSGTNCYGLVTFEDLFAMVVCDYSFAFQEGKEEAVWVKGPQAANSLGFESLRSVNSQGAARRKLFFLTFSFPSVKGKYE